MNLQVDSNVEGQVLMEASRVEETLEHLADQIHAAETDDDLILIGIQRRGVELTSRIARRLAKLRDSDIVTGSMDITLYRDDFGQVGPRPVIGRTELPGEITGCRLVIVDDVLYTGRTIRAALSQLSDFGRPRRVELCVLVDRGGRELPIQPDYVGKKVNVLAGQEVAVRVPELDGELNVALVRKA